MSLTFTFTDTSSVLSSDFFPRIQLDDSERGYELGLLSFESYNSVPNVDAENNEFHFDDGKKLVIPIGIYEVNDIASYIKRRLKSIPGKAYAIDFVTNNNTLQIGIRANFKIDFKHERSIGRLLGFPRVVIEPDHWFYSTSVDIFKVNSIQVECNIVTGSYVNGRSAHAIHQFFPTIPAGYKIVETPTPVIYLPVTTQSIDNITLRVVDQEGRLVDFRGERITVRLHLRKVL